MLFDTPDGRPNHIPSQRNHKDVLIKVAKFIFPVDFIILDYNIDNRVLIILGCLVFVIRGALIEVRQRILTMRLDAKEAIFKVYKPLNTQFHYKDLLMIMMMEG